MKAHIVLVEPQIPQNTGNIARTCAATGTMLHLIRPFSFSLDDRYLKRAGLDYWDKLELFIYDSFDELYDSHIKTAPFYFCTTKANKNYTDVIYRDEFFLVFGKETKGLDEKLLKEHKGACIRIPMKDDCRSLNLSNSAAVILYEALRQNDFAGLKKEGGVF